MKNKKTCQYCNQSYDYYEIKCPHCGDDNDNKEALATQHIPMMKLWRQILYFVVGSVGFQILATVFSLLIVVIFRPESADEKLVCTAIINFVSYSMLFIGLCLITWSEYKKLLKSFYILKWKPYVFGIVGVVAIFAFNLIYNNFLNMVGYTPQINENETGVRSIVNVYPLLSLIIFGFVGPVCEELTYRVGLFSFLRRIHISLAYIVSTLVFALIHFSFESIGTSLFFDELIAIVPYIFSGLTFAFLYHKFGFASSLSAHITNNLISILTTIMAGVIATR